MIQQVNINNWQGNTEICLIDIMIWQVVAEICPNKNGCKIQSKSRVLQGVIWCLLSLSPTYACSIKCCSIHILITFQQSFRVWLLHGHYFHWWTINLLGFNTLEVAEIRKTHKLSPYFYWKMCLHKIWQDLFVMLN